MAARKWTPEQKAKQSALIHSWKPWEQSTGAKTPEGKKLSSKNAFRYSMREVTREMARSNRALLDFLISWGLDDTELNDSRTGLERVLANMEKALIEEWGLSGTEKCQADDDVCKTTP